MRGLFLLILIFTWQIAFSQTNLVSEPHQTNSSNFQEIEFVMTGLDSLWINQLPTLSPESITKKSKNLPSSVNNAELQYFRPIFNQGLYPSCGQASGVSYNFTYEINRARNLPADVPENQYPTHYHWNFTNGGYGWFGSSYFHSFEILRTNGSPTVEDYGGMDYGGGSRWLNGYEYYYNGMHNRIEGVYKIDVSTPEGLETLKHWLHNHLNGSENGGVASFYANSPWNLHYLPPNTPEGGKPVIPQWAGMPTHAMTVVGYNDSIRWDYNGDGQYTNHLDINGDGVVDMRDWEIGGLLFANSYGENWANQGFAYMMYKTLAESVFEGGIWDNAMHVLKVNADYSPLLTAKITLKHTARGKVKVQVGVAKDPAMQFPQHTLDFPIFNFQGGNVFMQGGTNEEEKTIEFGLDITPLLDHVEAGQAARYFLQVIENDPGDLHAGEVVAFSIIDYSAETPVEHAYPDSNIALINNGITTLGISAETDFSRIAIQTEELPAFTPSEPLTIQLDVTGGLEPYKWALLQDYNEHSAIFQGMNENRFKETPFPGWNEWKTIDLDFPFPFYDTVYEQITVYPNGFIMFTTGAYPYPYWLEPSVLFRSIECIAPFMARNLKLKPENNDEIWFEPGVGHIRINWEITYEYGLYQRPLAFSTILFDDGSIEFHYESFSFEDHCIWLAGVSKGDKINYKVSGKSGIQTMPGNTAIGFKPLKQPLNITLTSEGFFMAYQQTADRIYDISLMAKDSRYISDQKTFQLTDAIFFEFSPVKESLLAGYTSDIEVTLHNIAGYAVDDLTVCFESPESDFVNWINPCLNTGDLSPGETRSFTLSEAFSLDPVTPEDFLLELTGKLQWEDKSRFKTSHFNVKKTTLGFTSIAVSGSSTGYLEPGGIYNLNISIANFGDVLADNVSVKVHSNDPFIILFPPSEYEVGDLLPYNGYEIQVKMGLHHNAPVGSPFNIHIDLLSGNLPDQTTVFTVNSGKAGIVIVDLDPAHSSATLLRNSISRNQFLADITRSFNHDFSDYDIMMVCLGGFPDRHRITLEESEIMEAFLLGGGNIYMEGGSTWRGDTRRPIHDMFMIQGSNQGWPFGIDSLVGNAGTFAGDFAFKYQSNLLRTDNMLPMDENAFVLFTDMPRGLHYAIAYENELYKTIGTTFKFNGIYQNPDDTIPALLVKEYLRFFGLELDNIAANFSADKYHICDGETVNFSLKTSGNIQQVLWEFEGGTPESSTEFSPQVRYDEQGLFSVKLIVNDGVRSDTLLLEEIITAESCIGIKDPKSSRFALYPNPATDRIILVPDESKAFDATIRIFDINGRLLSEMLYPGLNASNPAIINLAGFNSGIYFLQLIGSENFYIARFIIPR